MLKTRAWSVEGPITLRIAVLSSVVGAGPEDAGPPAILRIDCIAKTPENATIENPSFC